MTKSVYELFANFTIDYSYIPSEHPRSNSLKGIIRGIELNAEGSSALVLADFSHGAEHWDMYKRRTNSIEHSIELKPSIVGLRELSVFMVMGPPYNMPHVYASAVEENSAIRSRPWHVRRMGLGIVAAAEYIEEAAIRTAASGSLEVSMNELNEAARRIVFIQA